MTTLTIEALLYECIQHKAHVLSSRVVPTKRGNVQMACFQRADGALWIFRSIEGVEAVEPMPLSTLEVILRFPSDSITWELLDRDALSAFVARTQAVSEAERLLGVNA